MIAQTAQGTSLSIGWELSLTLSASGMHRPVDLAFFLSFFFNNIRKCKRTLKPFTHHYPTLTFNNWPSTLKRAWQVARPLHSPKNLHTLATNGFQDVSPSCNLELVRLIKALTLYHATTEAGFDSDHRLQGQHTLVGQRVGHG